MTLRRTVPAVLLLTLAALFACAPGATREAAPAPGADGRPMVEVEHNLPVATSMTVYLVDRGGVRMRLGSVAPGQTQTFEVREALSTGEHALVAQTTDGRSVTSRPFILRAGELVRWDMDTNLITPVRDS